MPKSKQPILPAVADMRAAALIVQRLGAKYASSPRVLRIVASELNQLATAEEERAYREKYGANTPNTLSAAAQLRQVT